jgi:predicted mannosyl-3-phosphoglycerate phosphatase (HAD superfamily)
MKVLYATDMDRTMIFSYRFIEEYPPDCEYSLVEEKEGKEISYMSNKVKSRLRDLNKNKHVVIVPVTTRSISEFERINLGINPHYAVTSNGGTILEYGKPLQEWEDYINSNIDRLTMMQLSMDIEDMESVDRPSKIIDSKYVFNKTKDIKAFDNEVAAIIAKYTDFTVVRQKDKVYGVPKCFNKAIALRWLQHKLSCDKLVASGDSELDLPMLAIADYAIIPEHGDLLKCGYVTGGRIANAGINSPLYTFDIIENLVNENKETK